MLAGLGEQTAWRHDTTAPFTYPCRNSTAAFHSHGQRSEDELPTRCFHPLPPRPARHLRSPVLNLQCSHFAGGRRRGQLSYGLLMDIEQNLLERCKGDDHEAWRELYDLTVERVYRLLLRMTRSEHDAFDLAQETYIRAFSRIGQFDGRSSVSTWLYRIAVNEALQLLRREKRVRNHLQAFQAKQTTESLGDDPATKIDVNQALESLPPADRALLLLRYQEGLDYREMAEVLECAEGTIASRLNRARQRLRGLLAGSYDIREETGAAEHPKSE